MALVETFLKKIRFQGASIRIATGFFWVGIFLFLAKLAGAAKEMSIAWRYGVGPEVDAYVFCFNLLNWPISVLFSVLSVVLIPLVTRVRSQERDARLFFSELFGLVLLAGLALGVVALAAMRYFLLSGGAGLSARTLELALPFSAYLSLLVPLGFLVSFFSSWIMGCGSHRNTLLEAVPSFILLLVVLAPSGWFSEPLVWGTLVGFCLHAALLGRSLAREGQMRRPRFSFTSPEWRGFWSGVGVLVAGQSILSFTGVIDQLFAAHLSTGAVSTLSYANRIMALLLGIGATAITRATLPVFSEVSAADPVASARSLTLKWARTLFLGGGALIALAWGLAPWGVQLLFERGAFSAENTLQVVEVFRLLTLQLPFYFAGMVFVAYFASQRRYGVIALSGGIGAVAKLGANYLFVSRYGLVGIALAVAVSYASTLAFFAVRFTLLRPRVG